MTTSIHPLPSVLEAQRLYVAWKLREHWARQKLHKVRAELWRCTGPEKAQLVLDEVTVEWLRAESEHWMIYHRSVLHAQGVQAI